LLRVSSFEFAKLVCGKLSRDETLPSDFSVGDDLRLLPVENAKTDSNDGSSIGLFLSFLASFKAVSSTLLSMNLHVAWVVPLVKNF
jgi:hypothetical protein